MGGDEIESGTYGASSSAMKPLDASEGTVDMDELAGSNGVEAIPASESVSAAEPERQAQTYS